MLQTMPKAGDLLLFQRNGMTPIGAVEDFLIEVGERLEHPGVHPPLIAHTGMMVSATMYQQENGTDNFSRLIDLGDREPYLYFLRLHLTDVQRHNVMSVARERIGQRYDWRMIGYLGTDYLLDGLFHVLHEAYPAIPQRNFSYGKPEKERMICSESDARILDGIHYNWRKQLRNQGYFAPLKFVPSPEDLALLPGTMFRLPDNWRKQITM